MGHDPFITGALDLLKINFTNSTQKENFIKNRIVLFGVPHMFLVISGDYGLQLIKAKIHH